MHQIYQRCNSHCEKNIENMLFASASNFLPTISNKSITCPYIIRIIKSSSPRVTEYQWSIMKWEKHSHIYMLQNLQRYPIIGLTISVHMQQGGTNKNSIEIETGRVNYISMNVSLPEFKLSFIWIFSQLLLGSMKALLVLFIEPDALIQSSWQHFPENRNKMYWWKLTKHCSAFKQNIECYPSVNVIVNCYWAEQVI